MHKRNQDKDRNTERKSENTQRSPSARTAKKLAKEPNSRRREWRN